MAIVTEKNTGAFYSPIGKVCKGGKKKTVFSKKHNKDVEVVGDNLDYFRFEPKGTTPDRQARLIEVWNEKCGEKPESLRIFFKTSDIDQILNDWFQDFGTSGIKIRCDGETIHYQQGFAGTRPCKNPGREEGCGSCFRSILFRFCLFDLEMITGSGDVELSTKSVHDRTRLRGQLEQISQKLAIAGQSLAYVPFILSRVKRTVTKTAPGRPSYREKESLLDLQVEPNFQARLTEVVQGQVFKAIGASYETLAIARAGDTNALAPASRRDIAPSPSQLALPEAIEAEVVEPWAKYWTVFLGGCDRCGTAEKLIELTDWAKKQKAYISNPDSRKMVDDKLAELALELASEEI